MNVRLLIADDHHLFLDGIVSLLRSEPGYLIETARNGMEVLEILKEKQFDVCLLDIGMPVMDGIVTARAIRQINPQIRIIILSTYNDREIVVELMKMGISGYLMKNCTHHELVEAIKNVHAGGRHFSPEVQNTIVSQFTSYLMPGKNPTVVLTPREIEIVSLLAKEYTNEKIASELNISFRTVETHRKNIMQKTGSHNLAGLLKFAYDNKLI
jgi:DNA-binding NarL/FixJ family response regulator